VTTAAPAVRAKKGESVPIRDYVPFAGLPVMQMECRGLGRELSILDDIEQLDDDARERVLQYAVDRWWLR
jgi:hypothetical protein